MSKEPELKAREDAVEIGRLPISQLDEGEVNLLQLPKEWCVWRDGDDLVYGTLRPSDSGDETASGATVEESLVGPDLDEKIPFTVQHVIVNALRVWDEETRRIVADKISPRAVPDSGDEERLIEKLDECEMFEVFSDKKGRLCLAAELADVKRAIRAHFSKAVPDSGDEAGLFRKLKSACSYAKNIHPNELAMPLHVIKAEISEHFSKAVPDSGDEGLAKENARRYAEDVRKDVARWEERDRFASPPKP